VRSQLAAWPVLAGEIPPGPDYYVPRRETGVSLASLPAGRTTVLADAADPASDLAGLGGTGKTSLAVAIAHALREDQSAQLVLWIAATGRDAVISGYAGALRQLDKASSAGGSAEQAAGHFLDWLAQADVPWLVVLDDLTDPAAAEGLWPRGPAGRVLVTTEHPGAAAAAHSPRVAGIGAFSPREALACLTARLDPDQRAGAVDLVTELGCGPAALGHASAFMATTGVDCRGYRARFTERSRALAAPGGYRPAVAATWSLSCELAGQLSAGGMAWRALALISMLAPHGIPGAVLTSQASRAYLSGAPGSPAEGAEVRAAVDCLARAGLVSISDQSQARTVLAHAAVQALTRQYLPPSEGGPAAQAAADALVQAWSGADPGPAVAQALRDCAARLQEIAGAFLWAPQCHPVLLAAGRSLDADGLAGPAVTYWRTMLGFSRQVLGEEHSQTAGIRDHLGAACEASGDHQTAIALYESALGGQPAAAGNDLPGSLEACERLSHVYLAAGRLDDATALAESAFRGCERNLGPDHPDTLRAYASLAETYLRAGRRDEATAAFRHVLASRENALGQDHLATIDARASLMEVYRETGRGKEAIALGRRIVAGRERAQGTDHPDTIAARGSLAAAYRAANKLKEALRLYEQVLADRERTQGTDHPDTIAARGEVALAYLSTRKLARAIEQYERALDDSMRALGPDHPITRAAQQNLGEAGAYAWSVLGIELRSAAQPKAP
jgi:tetratricopeptide (TPR) repeat protein